MSDQPGDYDLSEELTGKARARIERVIDRIKHRLSASEIAEFRRAMEEDEREEQERAGGA